jgi:phosphoesterase RecJ-like protein
MNNAEIAPPTAEETAEALRSIAARLRGARKVQVLGHKRPDGDCYGSLLGMGYVLDALGIENRLLAAEQGRTGYEMLEGLSRVEAELDPAFKPDLYIFVDSATLERVLGDWKPEGAPSISIDHHASNTLFADLNWVDPASASTAEMIYELARHLGVEIHAALAQAILLGLMTDTGSFRYSNVGPRQLEIAAELVRAGASPSEISRAAYESKSPEAMEVTGAVLSSLQYLAGGQIAWAEVRADLVRKVGGSANLPENLSAELRSIRGVRAALLFVELPEGGLRLSLRGDGTVNVSRLAAQFGGGGHPNAAGLSIADGDYEKERDRVLAAAGETLAET